MDVRIDAEFKDLIPALSEAELAQLTESILQEGVRDALVTWQGILLDGHNRHAIATEHGLPFTTIEIALPDRDAAILWMINNQLGRRNLTPQHTKYLLGTRYRIEKKAEPFKGNQYTSGGAQNGHHQTAERIASETGVSKNTVRRAADYAAAVDSIAQLSGREVKDGILQGAIAISDQDVTDLKAVIEEDVEMAKVILDVVLRESAKGQGKGNVAKEIKKVTKSRKKEEKLVRKNTVPEDLPAFNDMYNLICGDLKNVALEEHSLDCIITDPPYPKEFLGVYEDLGIFAKKYLKPGGSLICMVGQSYLPEIINMLNNHLTYNWTLTYLTPGGQSAQLWERKVNTFWKPLLWFVNADKYDGDWQGDVLKSDVNDNDKRFHYWGQSESGMSDIIQRFSYPGWTICDPFCGGGTTIVVGLQMNRKVVGIDIDQDAINTTLKRIKEIHDAN